MWPSKLSIVNHFCIFDTNYQSKLILSDLLANVPPRPKAGKRTPPNLGGSEWLRYGIRLTLRISVTALVCGMERLRYGTRLTVWNGVNCNHISKTQSFSTIDAQQKTEVYASFDGTTNILYTLTVFIIWGHLLVSYIYIFICHAF